VVLVGAVITLNVALGGMKGITLVQAFQYWAKMFAISVPIFVLMAVYGHYGKHLQANFQSDLQTMVPTKEAEASFKTKMELNLPERPAKAPADASWLNPFGPLTTKAAKAAKLSPEESKPLSLLYTYSLIIAIVCGTAGLPHILVRFYTNPDGAAAKRTTMWVMILIGVFYVFPPVFGVIGRNLLPDLYNGLGAKGTDKIVLELPRLLNEKYPPLGSILSGITCAGAFAAFMSTFSGLLVSMTGALAHDVYGRILRPKSTPEQRMRMFKIGAVLIGGVAIVIGSFVEPLEINFMVGQAFAIAAASYFPLLFMAVWWRKLTMKGAAVGMLVGGVCALVAAALTNFSNLALDKGPMGKLFSGFAPLNNFWAEHPLLRILCEQPAIWAVPLAIVLMIVVSKLTAASVPSDSRMKMLVLHAPEQLGLKQEYIQEHQAGPGH
jgi:Na+(H+)/acetate symporter ActP